MMGLLVSAGGTVGIRGLGLWRPAGWLCLVLALALGGSVPSVWAFDPPVDTAGPLTVRIDGPSEVTQVEVPVPYTVVLENRGSDAVTGRVGLEVIDAWRVQPAGEVAFQVPAGASESVVFEVRAGEVSYAALYPVHARVEFSVGDRSWTALPIRIVDADVPGPAVPPPPRPWRPWPLSADRGLALWQLPLHRSVLTVFEGESRVMPVGWTGSDPQTRGSVRFQPQQELAGDVRSVIAIHPPWAPGQAGTAWLEYPLHLPESVPLRLRTATAVTPRGRGDGVTFRVRVAPWDAAEGAAGEVIFERHSTAPVWEAAEIELDRFAGQAIRLQFESHPGPDRNTAYDQSYWAEPELLAGQPPAVPAFPPVSPTDALALERSEELGTIEIGEQTYDVRVWPGARGLLDACVGFLNGEQQLFFRGFQVRVLGQRVDDPRSAVAWQEIRTEPVADGLQIRHAFQTVEGAFELVGRLFLEQGVLRAHFWLDAAPPDQPWFSPHIELLAVDTFCQPAERIYAGHGNVLQRPAAFRLNFDGHRLATSHVGFDFDGGISLVQASDLPPKSLQVDPARRHYSLRTAHNATLSFIPAATVWQAARQYRETDPREAAGGVARLAGRFVFDLWGGHYRQSREELEHAFRYGLTDALVIWHNWQRWGYDYRLPEIYPPNPRWGTEDELRQLVQTCREADVLFALHDNYIDYYPDAAGFSYENKIAFAADGRPIRAWYNRYRQAQSYRYRAERVAPILQENLRTLARQLQPDAYFIDVWSSIRPYDYWTADGQFYNSASTRDSWAGHFDWIRQLLGNDAPQISESGHDQLIGSLDGATTNHLRVGQPVEGEYGWSVWDIDCEDAQRICWFDFAYHDRFILHGAGYSSRYAGGWEARLHGIDSDDYLSTEILTGHPGMVNRPFGRDVVRKYWLTQDAMRALALRTIEDVEFVDQDLHRQRIRWSGDGQVWVNRGAADWDTGTAVLPVYGFLAKIPTAGGLVRASLERRDGLIVETALSPERLYVNGRQPTPAGARIRPRLLSCDPVSADRVQLRILWDAEDAIPEGYRPFVHFVDADGEIAFQATYDHRDLAARRGRLEMSATARLPAPAAKDQRWELRIGLWHPGLGPRLQLQGPDDGQQRIRLGTLHRAAQATDETDLQWQPLQAGPDLLRERQNPDARPIDFGAVVTAGGCRLSPEGDGLLLVPLPDSERVASQYTLRWDQLPWQLPQPDTIEVLCHDGRVVRREEASPPFQVRAAEGVFAYRFVRRAD